MLRYNFLQSSNKHFRESGSEPPSVFQHYYGSFSHFLSWSNIHVLFPLQLSTRVFLVWAYQDVDDASNPRMFSMHTRRGHTKDRHLIITSDFAANPTILTWRFTYGETTTTRRSLQTTKAFEVKSSGFQWGVSFITISAITIISILLE